MNEKKMIKAIRDGKPLPPLSGVELDLIVKYDYKPTTVINELVLNNRLADLQKIVTEKSQAGKSEAEIKTLFTTDIGGATPLENLFMALIFSVTNYWGPATPRAYKDLICFLVDKSGISKVTILLEVLQEANSGYSDMISEIKQIMDECLGKKYTNFDEGQSETSSTSINSDCTAKKSDSDFDAGNIYDAMRSVVEDTLHLPGKMTDTFLPYLKM